MLILILYNFTWFFTVDLYIVNWYVLKCDDCPYGHVINVYCHLCACLCLQGLFPNLWYACTRYTEGNKLNWIEHPSTSMVYKVNLWILTRFNEIVGKYGKGSSRNLFFLTYNWHVFYSLKIWNTVNMWNHIPFLPHS